MSQSPRPNATRRFLRLAGSALVIVVAVGALGVGLVREVGRSQASSSPTERPPEPAVVTVYYFHGDVRCPTCRAIEARTTRTVHDEFADELAVGRLRFEVVNYDTPENLHFRDDFDLSFGSVIVQGAGADRPWENLADVWTLVNSDQLLFESYLVEHIGRMLGPPE